MASPIRLIVTDVDGCLGAGEAQPYDMQVLQYLAELNRAVRHGECVPAVTLCTGRPAAYVDAMLQTIDGFLPAIYENGAGLYFPEMYRFVWNPAIPATARQTILQARELLEKDVIGPGIGYLQPGKEMAITLFPMPGHTLKEVGQAALATLEAQNFPCRVEVSVTSVDIWLNGTDKGDGVKWLSAETGIPLASMCGVGDTQGDLSFLSLVGFSAAPSNAEPEVKACVDYVSPYVHGQGLVDIIEQARRTR
jgi:hydroxymethylpyrimidine pyrophosphatase-like HAD family hydrolase